MPTRKRPVGQPIAIGAIGAPAGVDAPYGRIGTQAIIAEGPDVRLARKQGLGLSPILLHLATDASRYGSLSVRDGRLPVARWLENTQGTTGLDRDASLQFLPDGMVAGVQFPCVPSEE